MAMTREYFGFLLVILLVHVVLGLHTVKSERNSTEEHVRGGTGDTSVSQSALSGRHGVGLSTEDKARMQAEARRRRREKERQRENMLQVESTILAASSDQCDWKKSPLLLVKGQLCGTHYKVLGVDRSADKSDIKKAHRAKSLSLHPDKNKAPEAATAFKLVSDAYECLIDDKCRGRYDHELGITEKHIQVQRIKLRDTMVSSSRELLAHLHYYVSIAANHIYKTGLQLWDLAGELEWPVMGEVRPVGRVVMLGAMIVNFAGGHALLKLHSLSYLVLRGNYELARLREGRDSAM